MGAATTAVARTTRPRGRRRVTVALALALALALCSCARRVDARDDPRSLASYDRYRQPDRLVAALGLQPGQRVADVGAGRGYLTFRVAQAVGPTGRVVATDIDPAALEALRARAASAPNVTVRAVAPTDPGLDAGAYDLVLLSEVDQYLPDRVDYLARLRASLAPRGRIAVTNRRLFRAPLVAAAARAGLTLTGEFTQLPYPFLVFLEVR